jgi:CheY-like chemotaxis protein
MRLIMKFDIRVGLIVAVLAGMSGARLYAQDEPAPDAPAADAPAADAPDADAPAADAPADDAPMADPVAAEAKPVRPGAAQPEKDPLADDPAVKLLRTATPRTPDELFRVIYLLVDLGRPQDAAPKATQFLAMKPDAPTAARIVRRYGTDVLLRLRREPRLGPDGPKMVELLLAGASQNAHDPKRIATLIAQLSAAHPSARRAALLELSEGGADAAAAMVNVLADTRRSKEHPVVRKAVVELGRTAVWPLVAALEASQPALLVQVLDCLGRIGDREAAHYVVTSYAAPDVPDAVRAAAKFALTRMVGALPVADEAQQLVRNEAMRHLLGHSRFIPGADGLTPVWKWDAAKNQLQSTRHHPEDAASLFAVRLARDLARLRGGDADARRLLILSLLQSEKLTRGLDSPLDTKKGSPAAEVLAHGVAAIDDALGEAVRRGLLPAAIAASELLGAAGDASVLDGVRGHPSQLVDATRHPDRRLRFAATASVMKLAPKTSFAGASYVAESLAYFASSAGRRRVLVADPRSDRVQATVGILAELGLEADPALSGKACQQLLAASADYELILVHMEIGYPTVEELVQHLRQDMRTATIPIGLLATGETYSRARRMALADPRMAALVIPTVVVVEDNPDGGEFRFHPLKHVTVDRVREPVRLAVHETGAGTDVVVDTRANRLLVRGSQEAHEVAAEVIKSLDVLPADAEAAAVRESESTSQPPPPTHAALAEVQITALAALAGRHVIDPELRLAEADQALNWLGELSNEKNWLYDLRRHERAVTAAMTVGPLGPKAAPILGNLGTHASQQMLANAASQHTLPLNTRHAAAAALAKSLARYGIQLTREEVASQYDRYNATRDLDEATQKLMAGILDALETAAKKRATPLPR